MSTIHAMVSSQRNEPACAPSHDDARCRTCPLDCVKAGRRNGNPVALGGAVDFLLGGTNDLLFGQPTVG